MPNLFPIRLNVPKDSLVETSRVDSFSFLWKVVTSSLRPHHSPSGNHLKKKNSFADRLSSRPAMLSIVLKHGA